MVMKIDREHVIRAFDNFTRGYHREDEKIKLKIEHTYRVAGLCQRIAQSLRLTQEEINLAWLIGMLHDVGRFEQLRRFGTFSDANSIDHAACGVEILFREGQIRDYLKTDEYNELIRVAVGSHNAYRLSDDLDERTGMHCRILRDADKIDILKVNFEVSPDAIYNVTTDELRRSVISPEVMDAFQEQHAILRSLKKTPIDNVVGHIALVFELVYPESYRIVEEQGYLKKLFRFDTQNEVARKQFACLEECMCQYLSQKRQEQAELKN